jgi:competence protein ComEC
LTEPAPDTRAAPAAAAAVFFTSGILLGARSAAGSPAAALLACFCVLLLFLRITAGRREGAILLVAFALLWASLGFLEARLRLARPAATACRTFSDLPSDRDRADRVEGVLTDFWSGSPPRVSGRMRAERLWVGGQWRPFPAEVFVFLSGDSPAERATDRGDRVMAVGHLTPEGIPASERDISMPWPEYRLSVKSARLVERLSRTGMSWLALPNRWLHARLPPAGSLGAGFDRNVRGPLSALLLGRTSELDRGMVARYRRGGLYHMLVIAGLHVALACGLAMLALRSLRVRGKVRDAVFLAVLFLFVLVGGGHPPAVRAGAVFGVHRAARLLERPVANLQAIGISALLLFAADPAQVYSIGTVLTFAAVLGIALLTPPIRARLPARPRELLSGLSAALAAQAATAPILLWRFNVVSAGAWLTAPLAIPLLGGMIALGAVLLLFFAAGWAPPPLISLFAFAARALEFIAERVSGAAFLRPTPPLSAVVAVPALLCAAVFAPRRLRAPAFFSAAGLFFFLAVAPGTGGPGRGFTLEALDVGQGDALLIRWASHAVLVDGGGPFAIDQRDFGRTRLLPKLLDRGVVSLDAAVLTHPHPDHALGLFAVLEELPVGVFWRSSGQDEGGFFHDLDTAAASRGIPVRVLAAGDVLDWPDAAATVVASGGPRYKVDAINNQSLILLFERDGRRALLTGDASAPSEGSLLSQGRVPRADVLKVGHHGSRSSTTAAFLEAVCPRAALLSCGRENRFGHPAPETLRTLAAARVPVFRTDLRSDVRIELLPGATRIWWRGLR